MSKLQIVKVMENKYKLKYVYSYIYNMLKIVFYLNLFYYIF